MKMYQNSTEYLTLYLYEVVHISMPFGNKKGNVVLKKTKTTRGQLRQEISLKWVFVRVGNLSLPKFAYQP